MPEDGVLPLAEGLPLADGNRILKRYVRPPSSL